MKICENVQRLKHFVRSLRTQNHLRNNALTLSLYRQNTTERKSLKWNNNNVPTNVATKRNERRREKKIAEQVERELQKLCYEANNIEKKWENADKTECQMEENFNTNMRT